MKKVTLEKVAECLSAGGHGVEVPESLRERAAVSLEKMLAFAADSTGRVRPERKGNRPGRC